MRSDPGRPLTREKKVLSVIFMLFACNEVVDSDTDIDIDTGVEEIYCIDGRGYEHTPGAFWQCDNLCLTCTCTAEGEIILAPSGPKIVTNNCEEDEKPLGPQLPPSPK